MRVGDLFSTLLFCFFVTLHADQLAFPIGGVNIRLNNLLGFFLVLLFICRYRERLFEMEQGLFLGLLALTCVVSLSFLFSPYKSRCFLFLGWYGMTLLLYIWFPYVLLQVQDVQKILQLYIASFLVVGLYAFMQVFLGPYDSFSSQAINSYFYRPNAFAFEPSYYALYMTPFVMGVNFYYLATRHHFKLCVFANVLFLISTSTSTVVAYGVFFVIALPFLRMRILKILPLLVCFGAVLCLCFPHIASHYFAKVFFNSFREHGSFFTRWFGIENAFQLFLSHPLVGVGLGGYPSALLEGWVSGDPRYVFLFHSLPAELVPLKHFEATNVATEVLASLGLAGAGAFIWLGFAFCRQIMRAYRRAPMWAANIFVSVIVMIVTLQINQGVLRTYVWAHFSLAYAFAQKLAQGESFEVVAEAA